ncbi:hypothetical protein SSP24_37050 [Streptomyces spinoverrucosus]|uniref:Uncharacterized protein n=1 Tax=Streptomyces spinoverrucosus TaxID=284043 RepID=A0A4Y3VJT3_9ACTN|nr:hypothetical protein SSP24_37050 [Streptomyces spinoverrucosus]GHB90190.1 hypothetical protein GCM10010397_73040 [Streptomyces spinoverrucosus]
MENEQRSLRWGHEALQLHFVLDDDGSVRLTHLVRYGHGKAGFELTGQGSWSNCGHLPRPHLPHRLAPPGRCGHHHPPAARTGGRCGPCRGAVPRRQAVAV